MSDEKRTRGPWVWIEGTLETLDCARLVGAEGVQICNFGNDEQYYPTCGYEPNDADKRLIAACPDLLDACIESLALLRNGRLGVAKDILAHAIFKAAGEAV
jgi:hypothetical protein